MHTSVFNLRLAIHTTGLRRRVLYTCCTTAYYCIERTFHDNLISNPIPYHSATLCWFLAWGWIDGDQVFISQWTNHSYYHHQMQEQSLVWSLQRIPCLAEVIENELLTYSVCLGVHGVWVFSYFIRLVFSLCPLKGPSIQSWLKWDIVQNTAGQDYVSTLVRWVLQVALRAVETAEPRLYGSEGAIYNLMCGCVGKVVAIISRSLWVLNRCH